MTRTFYGIARAESFDGGATWTKGEDSGIPGPSSRFTLRVLKSGRWLLINHVNFTKRNNLAALLSEDEGKTWSPPLMLDERASVSYPDATEEADGHVTAVYDRDRGAFKKTEEEALSAAREILMARFTEADILAGRFLDSGSFTKKIVSKLSVYDGPELF